MKRVQTQPGEAQPIAAVPGTRDWLIAVFDEVVADMRATMVAKNADYAGGAKSAGDCFANFTRVESLGIATACQGFLTRMTDKLMRVNSLTQAQAQVKSESISDTLKDLAVYSILMLAYLRSREPQTR